MKRFLFSALAIALVSSTFGVSSAQAGSTTLLALENGGTLTVGTLTFSDFTYSPTSSAGGTPPPLAANVTVTGVSFGSEAGITLNGSFNAAAGITNDYAITYKVTSTALISDAILSVAGSVPMGSGGQYTVGETFVNNGTTLDVSNTNSSTGPVTFAGVSSLFVLKDINVIGGSSGTTSVSIVSQLYSTTAVPEPASMALLGIGLTGLLAFRRRFKKASV